MPVLSCPSCQRSLRVAESSSSQRVRCPYCTTVLEVRPSSRAPAPKPSQPAAVPPPSNAGSQPITFRCPHCQQAMRVRREFAGKLTKCPNAACQQVCTVPGSSALALAPSALPVNPPPAAIPVLPPSASPLPPPSPPKVPSSFPPPLPTRNKRQKQMLLGAGMFLALLLLVGGVVAARSLLRSAAAHSNVDQTSTDQSDISPPPVPVSDLDFVPGDARGILSIRVADLWNSPPLQQAWSKLPEDMRAAAEQKSQSIGFELADFDRATVVIKDEVRNEFWAVIRTTQPFSKAKREKLLSRAGMIRWEKRSYEGFEYQLATAFSASDDPNAPSEPFAVYLASEQIVIVGTEPGLHSALDHFKRGDKGEARPRVFPLIEQGKDHLIVSVQLRDEDRAELPKPDPIMGLLVRGSQDVQAVLVTARFAANVELMGAMTYPDTGRATETRQQLETLKQLGRPLIQFADAQGSKDPRADLLKLLTEIETEVKGSDVVLHAKIDLKKVAPLLPDLVASQGRVQNETIGDVANLKQLALAFERYHQANGCYPKAVYYDKNNVPLYSWRVALLPYLGEKKLYDQFNKEKPWDHEENRAVLTRMPKVFAHPAQPAESKKEWTCYQLLTGRKAAFHEGKIVRKSDLTDGAANTLLLVEHQQVVPWTAPIDVVIPEDSTEIKTKVLPKLGVFNVNTFHVALFDGTIRQLKRTMKPEDFLHAIDPRDGIGLPPSE